MPSGTSSRSASAALDRPVATSSRAISRTKNGLPSVRRVSTSTSAGSGSATTSSSSSATAAASRGGTGTRRAARRDRPARAWARWGCSRGSTVRTVATNSTGWPRSSSAAYARRRKEVWSAQCRSSISTTRRPGWAASSRATAAKVRSVVAAAAPAPGAGLARSASPSSRSVTSGGTALPVVARSRSTGSQGQYGGARSASWQRPMATWTPFSRARWATSVASMDLPIPASPLMSSTPPWPASTRSARASWIDDSAPARPTTPESRARVESTAAGGPGLAGPGLAGRAGSRPAAGPSRAGSWARTRRSSSRTEVEGSTPSSSTSAARRSRSASRASACRSLR